MAVSGKNLPIEQLLGSGWYLRGAHQVTVSIDSHVEYIGTSRGEFSVCTKIFVATNSGWFSERSAAYLAGGRPVVVQDTGFSEHLPCGRGIFAVRTAEEAAAAIDKITGDYERHSEWVQEIAREHLDAEKVLGRIFHELGI